MPDLSPPDVPSYPTRELSARESWQLAEIETGLEEAQRGHFASDAELEAVLVRY
jgi:predicted transcriptional regulator